MRLFTFLLPLLLFCTCNQSVNDSKLLPQKSRTAATIIKNGNFLLTVQRGQKWQKVGDSFQNSGIFNELYGNVYIEDADFHLKATLSLEKIDTSTALCLLFNNHFGFDSSPNGDSLPGHFFFYHKKMMGKPIKFDQTSNYIQPAKPFDFEIIRRDSSFSFVLNQDTIATLHASHLFPPLEGFIGFRPWRNNMKIYDWQVQGQLQKPVDRNYIFEAGTNGYRCFRIPALIKTAKGDLLAFAEARKDTCQNDYGDIDLVLKRSTDNGQTWGDLHVLVDKGRNTVGNPAPVLDQQSGAITLLFVTSLEKDSPVAIKDGKALGTRRVFAIRSVDDGQSWTEEQELTNSVKRPDWNGYATGPGSGIQIKNGPHKGRLLVPCYHTRQDTIDYQVHSIYSDDGGLNWGLGGIVPNRGVNESEVAELPNGDLLLNMRNAHYKNRHRQIALSKDGGSSWQQQQFDSTLIEPQCQASLQFWDQQQLLLFANPADAQLRRNLLLRASADYGKNWSGVLLLHKGPAAYSDLLVLNENKAACLYEGGNIWPYQGILFRVFDRKEINRN